MNREREGKQRYRHPQVLTMRMAAIVEALGPAQGLTSGPITPAGTAGSGGLRPGPSGRASRIRGRRWSRR